MTIAKLLKEYEEDNVIEVFIYRKSIIEGRYGMDEEEGEEDIYLNFEELRESTDRIEDYKERAYLHR